MHVATYPSFPTPRLLSYFLYISQNEPPAIPADCTPCYIERQFSEQALSKLQMFICRVVANKSAVNYLRSIFGRYII